MRLSWEPQSSGNKGADQLYNYRATDLRLCFLHIMQKAGIPMTCSYSVMILIKLNMTKHVLYLMRTP